MSPNKLAVGHSPGKQNASLGQATANSFGASDGRPSGLGGGHAVTVQAQLRMEVEMGRVEVGEMCRGIMFWAT